MLFLSNVLIPSLATFRRASMILSTDDDLGSSNCFSVQAR